MVSRRTIRKYMFDTLGYLPYLIDNILGQQVVQRLISTAQSTGLTLEATIDQIEDVRIQVNKSVTDSVGLAIASTSELT